jgi:hypothetical protein
LVALVRQLRRKRPKGGQRSLRDVSAELSQRGIMNERGQPFSAASINSMLNARLPQPTIRKNQIDQHWQQACKLRIGNVQCFNGLDNREWSGETDVKRSLAQRFWNIVGVYYFGLLRLIGHKLAPVYAAIRLSRCHPYHQRNDPPRQKASDTPQLSVIVLRRD